MKVQFDSGNIEMNQVAEIHCIYYLLHREMINMPVVCEIAEAISKMKVQFDNDNAKHCHTLVTYTSDSCQCMPQILQ